MNPEQYPQATDLQPLIESGMGDILPQLIEIFLDAAPQTLGAARKALSDCRATELARAAHLLSGSCSNFGAGRLRELCRRLEEVGHKDSLEAAPELIESVEREFARVRSELLSYLEHRDRDLPASQQ